MRIKRTMKIVVASLLLVMTLCLFPLSALAKDKLPVVTIPKSATPGVPPLSDITGGSSSDITIMASIVSGGCGITKKSSTSVTINGFSSTPTENTLKITLNLQAYYNGGWHTMATKSKTVTGTIVSLSQGYTVSSGYYYRTVAYHSIADGTTATSISTSVYVN